MSADCTLALYAPASTPCPSERGDRKQQISADPFAIRSVPAKYAEPQESQVCSALSMFDMDLAPSAASGSCAPLSPAQATALFGHLVERQQTAPPTKADPLALAARARAQRTAAELREALNGRSLDAAVRLLNQPPEHVRALLRAYDEEQSRSGRGLITDSEKALGHEQAELLVALLARAGAATEQCSLKYRRQTDAGQRGKQAIYASPTVKVAVPGAQVRYFVTQSAALQSAGSYYSYQWLCLNDPATSRSLGIPALVAGPTTPNWDARWAFPGNHKIVCRIVYHFKEPDGHVTDHPPEYVEYEQTVQTERDVLSGVMEHAPQRPSPNDQLKRLQAYRQALTSAEQQENSQKLDARTRESLNLQINRLQELLKPSERRPRYPVKAAHVAAETARVSPLNVFVSKTASANGQETWSLVDLSNPTDRRLHGEYTGHGKDPQHAIQSAVAKWDSGNRYPKGRLRLQVPRETGADLDTEFQTDGASFWDSVAEFFHQVGFWAGLGVLGAAVATTLAPDPTVSKAAAVLLWTSILAGTTGTSIGLIQRHAQGMSTAGEDALDTLTLASNLLGARWTLGATVKGLSLAGSRMGTAVVIGRIGTDSAQGILLAAEAVKEYQHILADPDPKQRTDRLVQFLGRMAVSGGLLALSMYGNRADLQKLGAQRKNLARLGHTGEVISLEGAHTPHAPEDATHATALANTKPELPVPVDAPAPASPATKQAAEAKALADTLPGVQPHEAGPIHAGEDARWTASTGKPRVVDPVPGLFDSVDTTMNVAPPGWTFYDEVTAGSGGVRIRTEVEAPNGKHGTIVRIYNPRTRELTMYAAFLDELPNKIDAGVPLVPGSGTPTVAYLTLRQLKIAGGQFGQLQSVKMSTIQNIESLLLYNHLRSQGVSPNDAVKQTHSVQYAMTSIQQAGHTVVDVEVDLTARARPERIGWLMDAQESSCSTEPLRLDKVKKHNELLKKYGMKRSDEVVIDYDIYFELAPHPKNPR